MIVRQNRAQINQRWHLISVMERRKIRSIRALLLALRKHVDLSYDQVRRLVIGDFSTMPPLETLDALCRVLECHIGEILFIDHRRDKNLLPGQPPSKRARKRMRLYAVDVTKQHIRLGNPDIVEPFSGDIGNGNEG